MLDDYVRDAVMRFPSNEAACAYVLERMDKAAREEAVKRGVWARVTEHRHNATRELKGKEGYIPKTPLQKRSKQAAKATSRFIAKSILDSMVIAGTPLGDMTGERLERWANHEALSIAGHQQNIDFANRLIGLLPDMKTPVRDSVSHATAKDLFDGCFRH